MQLGVHYPKENVQILAHCGLSRGRFYDSLNRTRSSDHVRQNKNVKCDVVVFCRRLINHLALSSTTTRKKKKKKNFPLVPLFCLSIEQGKMRSVHSSKTLATGKKCFFLKRMIIFGIQISCHHSQIRGLRSLKCSSKTLQNLLYFFMHQKKHIAFYFSFNVNFDFPL